MPSLKEAPYTHLATIKPHLRAAHQATSHTYHARIKPQLHWGGPLILTFLGLVWLLHGYGLLPQLLQVPWLGGVLVGIGLLRLVMYFIGYY